MPPHRFMKLCESCEHNKNEYGKFYGCFSCPCPPEWVTDKQPLAHIVDTVHLRDYGTVSKARLNEMDRRVVLPYDVPGGGYMVGRRGENGKIQEKYPDIRK